MNCHEFSWIVPSQVFSEHLILTDLTGGDFLGPNFFFLRATRGWSLPAVPVVCRDGPCGAAPMESLDPSMDPPVTSRNAIHGGSMGDPWGIRGLKIQPWICRIRSWVAFTGWLNGWLISGLIGGLITWVVGWLVGWLIDSLNMSKANCQSWKPSSQTTSSAKTLLPF